VLRQLADSVTAPHVAQTVPLTPKAIRQIAHRYHSSGFTTNSGQVPERFSIIPRSNPLLPWFAVKRRKGQRVGRCA
jgi:hypothetical protein